MPKDKNKKKRKATDVAESPAPPEATQTNGKPVAVETAEAATSATATATVDPPTAAAAPALEAPPRDPLQQRLAAGRALRKTPRSSHSEWMPPADRRDPIDLLVESSADRLPELLPIRYGRMMQSPFSFYRGAAAIMAADLARTPVSGLCVQACGDCHLLNFGLFATPERRLVFDINDFDETLPAPWEWDIKRLATSFVIAGRHNQFKAGQCRDAALLCLRTYREKIAEFAKMRAIDVWYQSISVDDLLALVPDKDARRRTRERIEKAAAHTVVEHDYPKLCTIEGTQPMIRDNPPLIFHPVRLSSPEYKKEIQDTYDRYRDSMPPERRVLLQRYELADIAMKVVGVGSVGTRCYIALHMAGPEDPLFLQIKEARPSVLEPYAGKSQFDHNGQRVVVGQQMMQAASDIFLGWTDGPEGRHFYVRQLRDMKISPLVETYDTEAMEEYAEACGWCLAHCHAKTGDPAQISGYLGGGDRFDDAVADFAESYADQNERDHQELVRAVREGRIEVNLER